MSETNSILVLCGSIRARSDNRELIMRLAREAADIKGYTEDIVAAQDNGITLCNSEILSGAALLGASQYGAEVGYFSLADLFPPKDTAVFNMKANDQSVEVLSMVDTLGFDAERGQELVDAFSKAQGVLLSTPVYFGDRSSVANKFLQLASVRERADNKVYGVASVGAKRNGGQETCNIYSLYEMIGHGALGVGNGLPTSQYGGTAVGGDLGHVANDDWGMFTAYGTGLRVAHVSAINQAGKAIDTTVTGKVTLLLSMDTKDRRLKAYLEDLTRQVRETLPGMELSIINMVDQDIYRCLACKACPKPQADPTKNSQCVIGDPHDYLEMVRKELLSSDGFIVCGFNAKNFDDIITRYQVFTERMRFVRRSDYELSDKLVAGLCYHEYGATFNPIHSMKVVTSYVRHNTVLHKPIEIHDYQGTILNTGFDELVNFCIAADRLRKGKEQVDLPKPTYNAYGEGGGYSKDA